MQKKRENRNKDGRKKILENNQKEKEAESLVETQLSKLNQTLHYEQSSICFLEPPQKILMKLGAVEYKCTMTEGAKTSKTFVLDKIDNKNLEIRCIAINKLGICEITFPICFVLY